MNRLMTELQRLYFLDSQPAPPDASARDGLASTPLELIGPDGMARTLLVEFRRAGDWEQLATLHQQIQDDLDWPAPVISVSGRHGYRLWLSLASPVPAPEASIFLDALRRKYLADMPAANLVLLPGNATSTASELAPARDPVTGKWSAFIDPGLGAMFIDESGLDMAPNMDRQADLLAGFRSITAEDFARALAVLQPGAGTGGDASQPAGAPVDDNGRTGRAAERLNLGGNFSDPQSFLLAVINDRSASARQRIKAAKALLPYFAKLPPA